MDAIGAYAHEPDDRSLFAEIVASLGDPTTGQAVQPGPDGHVAPLPPAQEQAPPILAPAPAPVPAIEPIPLPAKPQPPALNMPNMPTLSGLDAAKTTGHIASLTGYIMSVGVGAFGQIMFLGTWLAGMMSAPGNWIAAVVGAAFAEIGMIGAGNSSLTKRGDGGRWKLLFTVACFVCASAVTMQVAHWLPKGPGVAMVFGLGSFVGFLIHMTIEHGKIRDHEDRMTRYEAELATFQAEEQARYEQELAAYNAAVAEQRRQHRQDVQAAKKISAPVGPPDAKAPAKPEGGRATKSDALRIGVERKAATPAKLRDALTDAGYTLPSSSTTVENWCKEIKAALAAAS